MKVIAFIEAPQGAVIEKILRHCGLWNPATPRPPPDDWGLSDADVVPSPFGRGQGEGNSFPFGSMDWPDADGFCCPADDFAQVAPDDSAYVDIDTFETTF